MILIVNLQSHTHSETPASDYHRWNVIDEGGKMVPVLRSSNLIWETTPQGQSWQRKQSEGIALAPGGWQLLQWLFNHNAWPRSGSFIYTLSKHGVPSLQIMMMTISVLWDLMSAKSLGLIHQFHFMEGRCAHFDPAIPLLGIYHTDTFTHVLHMCRWHIGRHICDSK